jgi:hypothetical protein
MGPVFEWPQLRVGLPGIEYLEPNFLSILYHHIGKLKGLFSAILPSRLVDKYQRSGEPAAAIYHPENGDSNFL